MNALPIFDRLVERATDQHGYVTSRDARELGIDPPQLRLMARRGRLEHVHHGVYRIPVLPRSEYDELARAVAWSGGRGVVSYESALVLHGLSDVYPARVHLTVAQSNAPRSRGGELIRVHRRKLTSAEVIRVSNLPVTTVLRTIVDCREAGTDPYQLRRAIDTAEAEGDLARSEAMQLRQVFEAAAGDR